MGEGVQHLLVAIETNLKEMSVSCMGGLGKPHMLLVSQRGLLVHDCGETPVR